MRLAVYLLIALAASFELPSYKPLRLLAMPFVSFNCFVAITFCVATPMRCLACSGT